MTADQVAGMTLDEAKAADAEWRKREPRNGPSPLFTWYAYHHQLPALRERWERDGDEKALWQAVVECSRYGLAPPPWLAEAAKNRSGSKRKNSADRHHAAVWQVLDHRAAGARIVDACQAAAGSCGVNWQTLRDAYYRFVEAHPITEVVRDDGWIWRKPTGAPDSQYQRHRRVEDPSPTD